MNLDQFCLSYEDLPTGKGQAHVLGIFHSLFISQVTEGAERKKTRKKKKRGASAISGDSTSTLSVGHSSLYFPFLTG